MDAIRKSVKKIALDLGIGKTTAKDWKKTKANIKSYCFSVPIEIPTTENELLLLITQLAPCEGA